MPPWQNIGTLITAVCAIGALVVSLRTSRSSAHKTDIESIREVNAELRLRIEELEAEVQEWRAKYEDVLKDNQALVKALSKSVQESKECLT